MSAIVAPSRALLEALHPARKRPVCECIRLAQSKRRISPVTHRNVSTTPAQTSEIEAEAEARPRWSQTPPAMKAPYQIKSRPVDWQPYRFNSDPQKLDNVYEKILGHGGSTLLTDETKWLAITHKSFDHGRRGFNDRLAFLGKTILELQMSLGLLNSPDASKYLKNYKDPHGREPFSHPAIDNIELLSGNAKAVCMNHKRVAKVAKKYDLPSVVRWQPKDPDQLYSSGCDMVYTQAVFAIIGAVALERGGAVANKIAREQILRPLMAVEKQTARVSNE